MRDAKYWENFFKAREKSESFPMVDAEYIRNLQKDVLSAQERLFEILEGMEAYTRYKGEEWCESPEGADYMTVLNEVVEVENENSALGLRVENVLRLIK